MKKISKKYWKEVEDLGIDSNLLKAAECGIWFKNIGCSMMVSDEKKRALIAINTRIQSGADPF